MLCTSVRLEAALSCVPCKTVNMKSRRHGKGDRIPRTLVKGRSRPCPCGRTGTSSPNLSKDTRGSRKDSGANGIARLVEELDHKAECRN